jgi:hypothetical protein
MWHKMTSPSDNNSRRYTDDHPDTKIMWHQHQMTNRTQLIIQIPTSIYTNSRRKHQVTTI